MQIITDEVYFGLINALKISLDYLAKAEADKVLQNCSLKPMTAYKRIKKIQDNLIQSVCDDDDLTALESYKIHLLEERRRKLEK